MTAINFNSIYTTYYRRAFLFTLSYVHNDLVAEDIVSEAIIYLWELSKKQEIPSIEAVLITYIRSKSLNYLKHLQVQENVYQNLTDKGQRELEISISTLEACVLYGLSGCTLDQIVQCTHHHNSAGTLVNDKVYVHVIAALYPLGLRADTFL